MARTFRVLLTPEEDGGYSVSIPSLPGCYTQGDSIEDALRMAKEAISLYVEGLETDGEPLPDDSKILEFSV
jgi:antitoxin HicB